MSRSTATRPASTISPVCSTAAHFSIPRSICAPVVANARQPVTMMMLDLDHFKSINDRFGHAIGDEVLRTFAEVARSSMRGSDIIGRLGGEEFAVIVAEPMELAARIAERLRAAFEEAGVTVGGHAIGATVSIGAATSLRAAKRISARCWRAPTPRSTAPSMTAAIGCVPMTLGRRRAGRPGRVPRRSVSRRPSRCGCCKPWPMPAGPDPRSPRANRGGGNLSFTIRALACANVAHNP